MSDWKADLYKVFEGLPAGHRVKPDGAKYLGMSMREKGADSHFLTGDELTINALIQYFESNPPTPDDTREVLMEHGSWRRTAAYPKGAATPVFRLICNRSKGGETTLEFATVKMSQSNRAAKTYKNHVPNHKARRNNTSIRKIVKGEPVKFWNDPEAVNAPAV